MRVRIYSAMHPSWHPQNWNITHEPRGAISIHTAWHVLLVAYCMVTKPQCIVLPLMKYTQCDRDGHFWLSSHLFSLILIWRYDTISKKWNQEWFGYHASGKIGTCVTMIAVSAQSERVFWQNIGLECYTCTVLWLILITGCYLFLLYFSGLSWPSNDASVKLHQRTY